MDIQTVIQIVVWGMAGTMVIAPIVYLKWIANHDDELNSHQKEACKCSANLKDDNNVALGFKGIV